MAAFNLTGQGMQRNAALSALLKAVSPSTLLRTVSLSNGLSNGSWTFYEAIITSFARVVFVFPPVHGSTRPYPYKIEWRRCDRAW